MRITQGHSLGIFVAFGLLFGGANGVHGDDEVKRQLESVTWTKTTRHSRNELKLRGDFTYELVETQDDGEKTTSTRRGRWSVLSQELALIALDEKRGAHLYHAGGDRNVGRYHSVGLRKGQLKVHDRPAEWLQVNRSFFVALMHLPRAAGAAKQVNLPQPKIPSHPLDRQTVPAAVQNKVQALSLPSGWEVAQVSNALLVSRVEPIEIYSVANLLIRSQEKGESHVEALRRQHLTINDRFVMTIRVRPSVAAAEYQRQKQQNEKTQRQIEQLRDRMKHMPRKFDSYVPSTPADEKLVSEFHTLQRSLTDLPDGTLEQSSLWISDSMGTGWHYADDKIARECRDVVKKVRGLMQDDSE